MERLNMADRIVTDIGRVVDRMRSNQEEEIHGDFGVFVVTPIQPGLSPVRYCVRLIAEKVLSTVGAVQDNTEPETAPVQSTGKAGAKAEKVWRKIRTSERLGLLMKTTLKETRATRILGDILHVECWGFARAIVGESKIEILLNLAAMESGHPELRVWLEAKKPIVYGKPAQAAKKTARK